MMEGEEFAGGYNLKLTFLKWLLRNHSIVRIAVKEEEVLGKIRKIQGDNVYIELVDWITRGEEGHMIVLQSYLDFFGEDEKTIVSK